MILFRKKSRQKTETPREETPEPTAAAPQETFAAYSGMRVEVRSSEDEPLFIARLVVSPNGLMELQPFDGAPAPEDGDGATPVRVYLRGYDSVRQSAVRMEGSVNRITGNVWRATRLRVVGEGNDRAYFRQKIDTPASVSPLGNLSDAEDVECRLENLSAGGVCILSRKIFAVGDHLLLHSTLLENAEVTLHCVVRRVTKRRGGVLEYGCEFVNMTPQTENRVSKTIMQLQMKQIRR